MTSTIKIETKNGKIHEISKNLAMMSPQLVSLMEDIGENDPIPLPNVDSAELTKAMQWCERHKDDPSPEEPLAPLKEDYEDDEAFQSAEEEHKKLVEEHKKKVEDCKKSHEDWDKEFLKISGPEAMSLLHAANYLNIKEFMKIMGKAISDLILDKTPREVCQNLDLFEKLTWKEGEAYPLEYTPEVEEQVRKENPWAEAKSTEDDYPKPPSTSNVDGDATSMETTSD